MLPAPMVAWAAKLALIWSGGLAGLLANFSIFTPHSLFGAGGALVVLLCTAVLTVRSNAIRFWKDEAEAERTRRERTEKERDEERELKHGFKAELAAERMKHDLTPILQQLVENQRDEALVVAAVEKNTATLQLLVDRLSDRAGNP